MFAARNVGEAHHNTPQVLYICAVCILWLLWPFSRVTRQLLTLYLPQDSRICIAHCLSKLFFYRGRIQARVWSKLRKAFYLLCTFRKINFCKFTKNNRLQIVLAPYTLLMYISTFVTDCCSKVYRVYVQFHCLCKSNQLECTPSFTNMTLN